MQPEEFQQAYRVRRTDGPQSCTGDEPCVHSAAHRDGWYCRLTLTGGRSLALGGDPDHLVCDRYCPYRPGPNPGPLADLGQNFRVKY